MLVAGVCFVISYVFGLWIARHMDNAVIVPAIFVSVACCIVRGFFPPLGIVSIAAVSVLHYTIGCFTVLILRSTKSSSTK